MNEVYGVHLLLVQFTNLGGFGGSPPDLTNLLQSACYECFYFEAIQSISGLSNYPGHNGKSRYDWTIINQKNVKRMFRAIWLDENKIILVWKINLNCACPLTRRKGFWPIWLDEIKIKIIISAVFTMGYKLSFLSCLDVEYIDFYINFSRISFGKGAHLF